MDLTPASPYAGKFAGYRIAEGKLNLDLDYELVGKKLNSKNVITLDQFTFGEKVNSPDATHLPVRLAIAILKDRDGKIVLDVPIEGSLDDPKFRIGKVVDARHREHSGKGRHVAVLAAGRGVWRRRRGTGLSGFRAGQRGVDGGGHDKNWIRWRRDFTRGPALKLEISGSVDPDGDREGLQRAALDQEIRTRIWMKLRKSEQATNSVDQIVLTPDDRAHWVKKIYDEAVRRRQNHAGTHRRQHEPRRLRRARFADDKRSPSKKAPPC